MSVQQRVGGPIPLDVSSVASLWRMLSGQMTEVPSQTFWVYKRGQLVLIFNSRAGVMLPTRGALAAEADPDGLMQPCEFASGQYLSIEWEPRVREIRKRAQDLVDFIELLEDRRYEVDLEPPSMKTRPFRSL